MSDTTTEAIIYQLLTEDQGVGDIVGDRVYPHHAADTDVLPFIVYQRISTARENLMTASDGLVTVRVQLDLYDTDHERSQELAEAVRLLLGCHRGNVGQAHVKRTWIDTEDEDYTTESDGSDDGEYRRIIDVMVVHTETATSIPSGS